MDTVLGPVLFPKEETATAGLFTTATLFFERDIYNHNIFPEKAAPWDDSFRVALIPFRIPKGENESSGWKV